MVTDTMIEKVSRGWISYTARQDAIDEWVLDPVAKWMNEGQFDAVWRLILALCRQVDGADLSMIANIGAGPVEEMIRTFGHRALDVIEPAVGGNPILLKALAMVWLWDTPRRERIDEILATHGQQLL
jgi:hypothetical protein